MSDEVTSGYVPTMDAAVKVKDEDFSEVDEIKVTNDQLTQLRQEIGRLNQVVLNLISKANETENELSDKRRKLADKYNLQKGQWALDFDKREFRKVDPDGPVIP